MPGTASHDHATPLTINRTLIEVALDNPQADESLREFGGTLLTVNQRHERLIDGLLTLASSEQGITDASRVDLADVARHITAESRAAAHAAGVDIRTHLQPAPVTGDPVLLERAGPEPARQRHPLQPARTRRNNGLHRPNP